MNCQTIPKMTASGKISQMINVAIVRISQNSMAIERNIIWTTLIKTLINTPCQSFCPYIGTKMFLIQIPNPKDLCLYDKKSLRRKRNFAKPNEYHQNGKSRMSLKTSQITDDKVSCLLFVIFSLHYSIFFLNKKLEKSPFRAVFLPTNC